MTLPASFRAKNHQFRVTDILPFIKAPTAESPVKLKRLDIKVSMVDTVNVFTKYGRPEEKEQVLTLRLEESGNDILVGEVEIAGSLKQKPGTKMEKLLAPFKDLRIGMMINEVTSLVGQPQKIESEEDSKEFILNYILQEKVNI